MIHIDPATTPTPELHQYLVGAVAPRPIAFVSTLSEAGIPNLAPYSFFNVFGSNPPTLVFSSNRRVRGNTTKDTLHNVMATREVVVNAVNYAMVHQMALASIEYPEEVNEFEKSGLTPLPAELVQPFRVKESPVQMECRVQDIHPLGTEGGAGHLIVCELVRMHLDPNILDEKGRIDPQKADLMGRMGRAYYCRASGENVFPILRPTQDLAMGFDALPEAIRSSPVLTGSDLAQLAGVGKIPDKAEQSDPELERLRETATEDRERAVHTLAQTLIRAGEVVRAWQILLQG